MEKELLESTDMERTCYVLRAYAGEHGRKLAELLEEAREDMRKHQAETGGQAA